MEVSFLRGHVSKLTQIISRLSYYHHRKWPRKRDSGSFGRGIKLTHMEFAYPGGIIISNLGAQSANPMITVLSGAAGAIIGALFTYYLNYAKTKL